LNNDELKLREKSNIILVEKAHKIFKQLMSKEEISEIESDFIGAYLKATRNYIAKEVFDLITTYKSFLENQKVVIENKKSEYNFSSNDILSKFNPVEGGETTLYYLRLVFRSKKYYKVGVTINSVKNRYSIKDFKIIDKILYEKKLTHANTIEKEIIRRFKDKIFPLSILSSGESEIFDEDVLEMDK